jgi:hypothetical protein
MGKQRPVDKVISPAEIIRALQAGSITTAQAQAMFNGVIPIGDYKGIAAILDLDKLVVQPLVWAEQQHILGNLDGVTAGVDLLTLTVPAATAAGVVITGSILVPAGEVWFINGVVGTCLADATGTIVYNWRCSLFPLAGVALGAPYHTAWLATPLGPQFDEFSAIATLFAIGNKPVPLRLPAGATISGQLMNAVGAAACTGVVGTLQLFGWKGKLLVA